MKSFFIGYFKQNYILLAISVLLLLLSGISLSAAEPKVVRIAAFNFYPGIFKDTDGVVKGFYVDALADIAQRENIKFEYVYGSWSEGLERIKSGEVDVLTSVAFTEERAAFLDYTVTPLLTVWGELYTPLESEIEGIREVRGKKIAIMEGDYNARNFIDLVKKFDIPCEFVPMPGFDDVFRAVATRKVDAGVVNNTFGAAKQKEYGLRSTGVVFNPFDIFFAVAKGKNQRLLALLENNLTSWRHQADSPFNKAREKWSHSGGIVNIIPRWLVTALVLVVLSMAVAVGFVVVLKRQVRSKTKSHMESEDRYKALSLRQSAILASVPDIIMETDLNKVYTWANPAGLEFFGDDVIGREACYYFEGEQNTYEILQPLFNKSKEAIYVESLQRRKDGAHRLLAWWSKALVDEQGVGTGTLSTARDITENKLAEQKLQSSEENLSITLHSIGDGVISTDKNGRVVQMNRMAENLCGWTIADASGKPLSDVFRIVNAETLETVPDPVKKVLEKGDIVGLANHTVLISKNGCEYQIADSAAPIKTKDGEIIGVVLVFSDVTEKYAAQKKIKESEEDLKESQRIAHVGSWRVDISTNDVTWSEELYNMFGFDPSRPPPSYNEHHKIFTPESWNRLSNALPETLETGIPYELELETMRQDGSKGWMWVRGEVVRDAKGTTVGLWGAAQDITDRKQAEDEKISIMAQLNQAQKMESVGRLAGGVAHDFNNMLGVILGHTDMILEELDPALPIYADLEEIRYATVRSADLTRQLLAFARKQTVSPKELDLNKIVEGMLNMLHRLIGEDITINWRPGENLGLVNMDPTQIDQLLVNLCVNARDAIANVGKITIETGSAIFDEDYYADHAGFVSGEFVVLAVSDDGCGMDRETQANIFEPFFTTKEQGKGTGLGLATIYGIVKQNNGFINVYSELNQGSTFKIYLPRHIGKTRLMYETEAKIQEVQGHETILLVEDEPSILKMTTMMLERHGYTVLSANTPGEAHRLAQEFAGEIHLLMTDVVMPEMNGRDLAKKLLTLYPNLKRLFMSGYTANVIAHHGVLDEGVHFIQKPFSKKDLVAKVKSVLA